MSRRGVAHGFDSSTDRPFMHTAVRRGRPGALVRHHGGMPFFVDTHCHLDAAEFAADRDTVRAQAAAVGVAHCVIPAVERANWDAVRQLALPHRGSACCDSVTLSMGVTSLQAAHYPGADAAQALFQQADAALYTAKQTGRNRVVLFGADCMQALHS